MIARVAVFTTLDRLFDYEVAPALAARIAVGARVWVPWRTGALEGVVWELTDRAEHGQLKTLSRLVDAPALDKERLDLARWIAEYYVAPPGDVARLFLPVGGAAQSRTRVRLTDAGKRLAKLEKQALVSPEVEALSTGERALLAALGRPRSLDSLRKLSKRAGDDLGTLEKAGLVTREEKLVARTRDATAPERAIEDGTPPVLTPAQARAVEALEEGLGAYAPYLLHGVTGSGKTEVYLRVIAAAIARGKHALVLVPEIALTPQLTQRFEARFGNAVAVLHSALTDKERQTAWARLERGEASIALGARSAVFAPQPNLGVVVVDEEHDPSFKQDDGVRYHGRDAALRRARLAGAIAILGSATPSMETYAAAKEGRIKLLELPERAAAATLPPVEILDLKQHKLGASGFLCAALETAIGKTLEAGEQSILFLNRRGFSTFVLCKACGKSQRCRDCAVSLTFHRGDNALVCHYCGFRTAPPKACTTCGAEALERLGYGTEQVQAVVEERFPRARVARLDRDTAEGDGLETLLAKIRGREVDIVVGTQMITKGHDFPSVTLVGVVLADHAMGLPDFRASERSFQLLSQVAGRAGRGVLPGRVLVQTYNPHHPAITCARDHDYVRFFETERLARDELGYPPSLRLACVRVDGVDAGQVRDVAERGASAARLLAKRASMDERVDVLGPSEAPPLAPEGSQSLAAVREGPLAARPPPRRTRGGVGRRAAWHPGERRHRPGVDALRYYPGSVRAPSVVVIASPYEGELLGRALADAGLRVLRADDGEGAHALVATELPLALVLGTSLFSADPSALVGEAQARGKLAVFVVADEDDPVAEALRPRVTELVRRPLDFAALARRIERLAVEAEVEVDDDDLVLDLVPTAEAAEPLRQQRTAILGQPLLRADEGLGGLVGARLDEALGSNRSPIARAIDRELSQAERRLFPDVAATPVPFSQSLDYDDALGDIDLDALGLDTLPGMRRRADAAPPAPITVRPVQEEGTLEHVDIAELVGRLHSIAFTGALEVTRPEGDETLYFDHGEPIGARSTLRHAHLAELLFRDGKLTRDQVTRLHASEGTAVDPSSRGFARPVALRLVEEGLLKESELFAVARHHLEEVFFSAFALQSGEYRLGPALPPADDRVRPASSTWALVTEGVRRKYSLERLTTRLDRDALLSPTAMFARAIEASALTPDERHVAALFDGHRSLGDVRTTLGRGTTDSTVFSVAWSLVVTGALDRGTGSGHGMGADLRSASTVIVADASAERRAKPRVTDLARQSAERGVDRDRIAVKRAQVLDADYFAILGVGRDVTDHELRRAHARLRADFDRAQLHPDVVSEQGAALDEIVDVLDEALRVLSIAGIRARYAASLVSRETTP